MEDLGEMHINERRLFHGTSQEVIPKICKEGFDWRLYGRNGSAFGQGTYFARDAQYSHTYSSKHGPIGLFRSGHRGHHRARINRLLNQTGLYIPPHHQGHQSGFTFGPGPSGFTLSNLYGGSTGPQQPGFPSAFPASSNTGQQQSAGFPLGASNTGFGNPPSTTSAGFSFGGPSSGSGTSNTGFTFGPSAGGSGFFLGNQPGFIFGSDAGADDDMVDPSKSFMFVGRVLVGRVCRGEPNMRRPPNDESDPQKRPCHTAVDHVNRPSIFVVFESAQCYPEYLVEYTELL